VGLLARLALIGALAGCFQPTELDGVLHCGEGGSCPEGFECGADGLCWRPGSQPIDASDAPLPAIDAAADALAPDAFIPQCSNGIDDDCDGKIDRAGGDPGCSSNTDDDERGTKECDDGIDNDVDGYRDYVAPGCGTAIGDPQCDKADDDDEH